MCLTRARCVLIIATLLWPLVGHTSTTPLWTLAAAEQRLALVSPQLAAARAHTRSLQEKARYRTQLPDPTLSFGPQNLDVNGPTLAHDSMSAFVVGVSQNFPPWGKLSLLRRGLDADSQAARALRADLEARLLAQLRAHFCAYYDGQQALKALRRDRDLYVTIANAARTSYENGRAPLAEVLRARYAAGGITDQISILRATLTQAKAQLAALLALPSVHIAPIRPRFPRPSLPGLLQDLRRAPSLNAQDNRIRAARDKLRASRRDLFPSYGIGASYGLRTAPEYPGGPKSPNQFSVEIRVSLPLFPGSRQNARIARREALVERAVAQATDARFQFIAQVHTALGQYKSTRAQLKLLKQVRLPQARAANQSALRAYANGHMDIGTALRYTRSVTHAELSGWTLAAQLAALQARLDYFATRLEHHHAD
ncbi:MAG: TolC family protein [Acidiferrobacter sp.]